MTVSALNIQVKFPEFATTDPAAIEFALEEASLFMANYNGPGRDLAQMYLCAHFMSITANAADEGGRDILSETIGPIHTTYKQNAAGVSIGDLASTFYGKRYSQIINLGSPKLKTVRSPHHHRTTGCD